MLDMGWTFLTVLITLSVDAARRMTCLEQMHFVSSGVMTNESVHDLTRCCSTCCQEMFSLVTAQYLAHLRYTYTHCNESDGDFSGLKSE